MKHKLLSALLVTSLACAPLLPIQQADAQGVISILNSGTKLELNPDKSISTKYPAGNKPPSGAALTCSIASLPPLTGLPVGVPFSFNVRSGLFTGTSAAGATITVSATGTNAGSWQISGNNLVHNGILAGSGSLFVRGLDNVSGLPTNCDTVSWSFISVEPSTDTLAPTYVFGLRQSGSATGSVTLTHNAAVDNCGAGIQCTGIDHYNYEKGGVVVATQAASPGLLTPFAMTNIGGASGSCTRTGNNLAVTGSGDGIDGVADSASFCGVQVAGTQRSLQACFNAVSSTADYNKTCLDMRASQDSNASTATYCLLRAPGASYLQVDIRNGTGTTRTHPVADVVTLPVCARISGSGDTFTFQRGTGGEWVNSSQHTIAMPPTIWAGVSTTATDPTKTTTASLTNVSVSNAADVTKTITTASAGSFAVKAVDVAGNISTAPISVTATPGVVSSGLCCKYDAGTYVWYAGKDWQRLDLATTVADVKAFIDTIADDPEIEGIQLAPIWGTFESGKDDYTKGFAAVDSILSYLASKNKKLMIQFWAGYSGGIGSVYDIFPAYIVNESQYGLSFSANGGQMFTRVWQTATNDRLIKMMQAYGARYDSNPTMHMIGVGETAINTTDGSFSNAALLEQLKRLISASRAAWPTTQIRIGVNDLYPDALMIELMQHCKIYFCALGGPDVWPLDITQADRVFAGLDYYGNLTGEDLRDKLPWAIEIQWQSFGGLFTLQQLYDAEMVGYSGAIRRPDGSFNPSFALPSMKPRYMIWYVNPSNGPSNLHWGTGEKTFIKAHPTTFTPCPTLYPTCTGKLLEPDNVLQHFRLESANESLYQRAA